MPLLLTPIVKPITKPRSRQRIAFILPLIEKQYITQASKDFSQNRQFNIPTNFQISERLLQGVYNIFRLAKTLKQQKGATIGLLKNNTLELEQQENKDRLPNLIDKLNRIAPYVYTAKQKHNEARAAKTTTNRAAKVVKANKSTSSIAVPSVSTSSIVVPSVSTSSIGATTASDSAS